MTNDERQVAINEILAEIKQTRPDWSFLSIKIQTNTFIEGEDPREIHRKYNELDNRLHQLNNDLRGLQVRYFVDYFDDQDILRTCQMMLNRKVEIDTLKNGWAEYMNDSEARQLMVDVCTLLLDHNKRAQLHRIVID